MECTGDYINRDNWSDDRFERWRRSQGGGSLACGSYPYCSHYGGAFFDPIPPWLRREEARHSDIPKGMARALIDGQLSLGDWTPYGSSWYHYPGGTPYARMFRHPRITGKWTTQETLSFID